MSDKNYKLVILTTTIQSSRKKRFIPFSFFFFFNETQVSKYFREFVAQFRRVIPGSFETVSINSLMVNGARLKRRSRGRFAGPVLSFYLFHRLTES